MNGQYGTRKIPMSGRHKAARAFVIVGGVLLFPSAAPHFFGGYTRIFPLYFYSSATNTRQRNSKSCVPSPSSNILRMGLLAATQVAEKLRFLGGRSLLST